MEIPNEEARRVFAGGHFLRLGATQPSSIDWKRDPIVGLKTLSSEPFSCGDSRAPSEAGFLQPTEDPAVATSSLAAPVGSNITEGFFFVPGTNGAVPAEVSGFGAVFTDVDQPNGSGPGQKHGNRGSSTLIEYFGANGELLFSSFVPASPGDGSLSFFGIVFDDPCIARVRITTGDVAPGPDDSEKSDVVVMDDFIYGEPIALQ